MKFKILIGVCLALLLWPVGGSAQPMPEKPDSTKLYRELEDYSKRSRFMGFFYKLIFKSTRTKVKSVEIKKVPTKRVRQHPYFNFEGKVIRSISIETLDPFVDDLEEGSQVPSRGLSKLGNSLHIRSQDFAVRNLLLIRQHQRFDSLLVKESERLIRTQNYVQDVRFLIKTAAANQDSVDILIRVLDNWSLVPKVSLSTNRLGLQLTDNNIIGTGHRFQTGFKWNHSTGNSAHNAEYSVPNIYNTHIRSALNYRADEFGNYTRILDVERPFFSPLARWAGGALVSQEYRSDSLIYRQDSLLPFTYKFNTGDFWFGHSARILKGNSENARTTHLIWANRYLRIRQLESPDPKLDSLNLYSDEDFFLTSAGVSSRRYIRDQYIFYYGIPEDVPLGMLYELTFGIQKRNGLVRYYAGARYAMGNYFKWGYFGCHAEIGSFIHGKQAEQTSISGGLNYFTDLLGIGNWRFRHFIKQEIVLGNRRLSNERLTLNEGNGLDGFNSSGLTGTSRWVSTFQTQSYPPWSLLGFHFGPFINYSFGFLGDASTGFKNSKMYSQIAVGVLIHNEHLVFNTFQISFSFFPTIPGVGEDLLKFNSVHTANFGFRDFSIEKPARLPFE